jgi:hypothetical protein
VSPKFSSTNVYQILTALNKLTIMSEVAHDIWKGLKLCPLLSSNIPLSIALYVLIRFTSSDYPFEGPSWSWSYGIRIYIYLCN